MTPKSGSKKGATNCNKQWGDPLVPHVKEAYWQRINANGRAPNDLFSWKRKKQQLHNNYYKSLLLGYPLSMGHNLLTLLATDPPSSHPEWVFLHLFSCFPHHCWVPTDSSTQSKAGPAPHPPPQADRFEEALDPGNCPFLCRAPPLPSNFFLYYNQLGSFYEDNMLPFLSLFVPTSCILDLLLSPAIHLSIFTSPPLSHLFHFTGKISTCT